MSTQRSARSVWAAVRHPRNSLTGYLEGEALLPGPVRVLASVLPFQWMVAFPVELMLGRVSPRDALIGFGMLLGWLLVGVVALRVTWRQGVRQYSAVGA